MEDLCARRALGGTGRHDVDVTSRRTQNAARALALTAALLGAGTLAATPAIAATDEPGSVAFPLPDGFQPEGITIDGDTAYLGSLRDGDIYRLDLDSGVGEVLSQGPGTPSVGIELVEGDRLFVAGGAAGDARVVDAHTGEVLASYALGGGFVNDVVVTDDAAYFSDSVQPVIHVLPLGAHGELPTTAERLPISGELVYGEGFNANGIETTPDGDALLLVQSGAGLLFRADPSTGATTAVDLGGELLTNGDGLTRDGSTLYAVQNQLNTVAVLDLADDGRSAEVTERVTDPLFDVPTTVAVGEDRLYLPNARFGTPPTPETTYAVIGIPIPC